MSNVPKLRFKEFSGEWEIKPLSQVAGMKAGKFVKASDISNNQEDKMYPCYGGNGLRGYVKSHTHNGTYPLIGRQGALCGNIQLASGKFHATEHAVVVTPTDKNDILWLYYELDRLNLNRFATGQAQPGLSVEVIQQVKTNIPLKQEQEKIASFLTSVDTKIEQLTKKEQLLSSYKKGVMQKIFNQEIRFKADDGSEFCDWEEKKIKELFIYKNGGSFESNVIEDGQYNLITLNSIDINGELKLEHKRVNINDNSLSKNDLIMVLSDVAHGNFLGLTAIIPEDNVYVLNQRMGALKPKTNNNISFIRFYINFNQKYFKLHGQGSSQQNLSKGDIEKFIVNIPCLAEQTKIANFLSSIDSKIEQVQKQLTSTKEFKKALLQQMFV